MIIKILGGGCKSCMALAENAQKAVDELQIDAEIIKVTDFVEILKYDILATPGLVIDEKLVSSGKILKPEEIKKLLEKQ